MQKPYEKSASRLPDDVRFHPPIGNGHVATNVLSDTIYMNGLFNGREDYSSRARIQSTVAVDAGRNGNKQYTLDMYEGIAFVSLSLALPHYYTRFFRKKKKNVVRRYHYIFERFA